VTSRTGPGARHKPRAVDCQRLTWLSKWANLSTGAPPQPDEMYWRATGLAAPNLTHSSTPSRPRTLAGSVIVRWLLAEIVEQFMHQYEQTFEALASTAAPATRP